jgi:nuclear transport factor 2 (NTF2) superfamily protein
MDLTRPPLPPFSVASAAEKVRLAEDGWNSRNPERVAQAYSEDSRWRNRSEFVNGREEIIGFLARKWQSEFEYRLIKELWAFTDNRIAVRFAYEWHDDSGNWFRSYGNEIGSSEPMASCKNASPASTICRSSLRIDAFTGHLGAGRTNTPVSALLAFKAGTR